MPLSVGGAQRNNFDEWWAKLRIALILPPRPNALPISSIPADCSS